MNHLNKILLAMLCTNTHASPGAFFSITESGTPTSTPIKIELCLNATAGISCQTSIVSTLELAIRTTIPKHRYPNAGIRIITPGYSLAPGTSCTPGASGYCQFSISNDAPTTINLAGGQTIDQYLYVPNTPTQGAGFIEQGVLEPSGSFTSYAATPVTPVSWYPTGIAFAAADNGTHAYVSSSGITVGIFVCDLSPQGNGELSSCVPTSTDSYWTAPSGITFATTNAIKYGYVPDPDEGYISSCKQNPADGTLIDFCIQGPRGFVNWNKPSAIAFATTQGGTQYGYFTDLDDGAIYQCAIIDDNITYNGILKDCATTGNMPTGSPNAANGIAFATFNGTTYAYITNRGTETVYQCSWNASNGNLSNCVDAASFMNQEWTLKGIAFGTVNSVQYAYVSDYNTSSPYSSGTIWQCAVNNNNGLFNTCNKTPAVSPSQTGQGWFVNGSVAIYPAS